MKERVDFCGNAPTYDRRHGAFVPEELILQLLAAARLPLGSRILEIGAGTGRVAIPFARLGHFVVALDPAPAMLASLSQKSGVLRVPAVVGDGTQLPFARHRFDAVVIARLLYLVPDWRGLLLEAHRVLKPGRVTTGFKSASTPARCLRRLHPGALSSWRANRRGGGRLSRAVRFASYRTSSLPRGSSSDNARVPEQH